MNVKTLSIPLFISLILFCYGSDAGISIITRWMRQRVIFHK